MSARWPQLEPAPVAERVPVTEVLHGVTITDPYRWLEESNNPRTREWGRSQTERTRRALGAVPWRQQLREELWAAYATGSVAAPYVAGDWLYFERRAPSDNQPTLRRLSLAAEARSDPEQVIVDPNHLDDRGLVSLDWWMPSSDGKLVAYGLSSNGDEWSTLYITDATTGKRLDDTIPRTRGASVAWEMDASGFFYTRYPLAGTMPESELSYHQRVFYHRLGSPSEQDPLIYGDDWPRETVFDVSLSQSGRYLLLTAMQGWSRSDLLLADRGTAPQPTSLTHTTAGLADEQLSGELTFARLTADIDALWYGRMVEQPGTGEQLFVRTDWHAPCGRILSVDLEAAAVTPPERWHQVVQEPAEGVYEFFVVTDRGLAIHFLHHASSVIRMVDLSGRHLGDVQLPLYSGVSEITGTALRRDFFRPISSFGRQPAILRPEIEAP